MQYSAKLCPLYSSPKSYCKTSTQSTTKPPRTDLKQTLPLSLTPSFALVTMLYCMTEMVIFALCDSSHFEADIWLVLSPQCMM